MSLDELTHRPHRPILTILLIGFGCFATVSAQNAGSPPAVDSGVFDILSGNRRLGTEKFEIRASGAGWIARGELEVEGPGGAKVTESSVLSLNSAAYPLSYERTQKSPRNANLVVNFGPTETALELTSAEGPFEQIFYLPKNDLAVLDTNFFHQYTFLLRLYDRARGTPKPLNVFIPQEALPGTINLQYLAREEAPGGQPGVELDHFQAVTDELEIEIWATPEGAIQRIAIPAADLAVVRR